MMELIFLYVFDFIFFCQIMVSNFGTRLAFSVLGEVEYIDPST